MPKRKAASRVSDGSKQTRLSAFFTGGPKEAEELEVESSTDADLVLKQLIKDEDWSIAMAPEFKKPYFKGLEDYLKKEYAARKQIFPPRRQIFAAFNSCPMDDIRVVILGQDPYHDVGQAHGFCFSVEHGVPAPPSLKNIYKELKSDIDGFVAPSHGNLLDWAKQGVFLLNATLTVEAHKPNSHSKIGWQEFTDAAIKAISSERKGVVFILWGGFAQKKEKLIDAKRHTVIKSAHPSPLSVTKFLGCKCFSQANAALESYGKKPIEWSLK